MKCRGFSLVELSIVLVVLGLLIGAILGGKHLIRAAELRAILTELYHFKAAVRTFKSKYYGLPGDITNATAFWGDNSSLCADASIDDGLPGTCNGDGDGIPHENSGVSNPSEIFLHWQHMAFAGLIEGQYSGQATATNDHEAVGGFNVPESKLTGGLWMLDHCFDAAICDSHYPHFYAKPYKNFYVYGKASSDLPDTPLLTSDDAWSIDIKIDDGLPAKGGVNAAYWNDECATINAGPAVNENFDASYNLDNEAISCALIFGKVF